MIELTGCAVGGNTHVRRVWRWADERTAPRFFAVSSRQASQGCIGLCAHTGKRKGCWGLLVGMEQQGGIECRRASSNGGSRSKMMSSLLLSGCCVSEVASGMSQDGLSVPTPSSCCLLVGQPLDRCAGLGPTKFPSSLNSPSSNLYSHHQLSYVYSCLLQTQLTGYHTRGKAQTPRNRRPP